MDSFATQILPVRKRCEVVNHIVRQRLDTIVPAMMRETGFDMWLIICLEDVLDPVFKTMIPMDTWCPILQMLVFYDRGGDKGVERINLSRTKMHDLYDVPYIVQKPELQWGWLREVIEERNPRRIAINQGEVIWAADGLSASLKQKLVETLPQPYVDRLASGEDLCRRYLETLTREELEIYPHVCSIAHNILREIYSRRHITPGVTMVADLTWAYAQRVADLGLELGFSPMFHIVRNQATTEKVGTDDTVIRHGDLVGCDVGIRYLRLISDNKQWAYVLRPDEHDAPEGLKQIFADALQLQDIYMGEFVQGRTGNEILRASLAKAREAGLNTPRVYSHSCGILLHEPGPLIGHPFEQENWAGRGDVELNYNSTFVAETSVDGVVPEWQNQTIRFGTEEQFMFTKEGTSFMDGRQTEFYLV